MPDTTKLDGSAMPIELSDDGYSIEAPDLRGSVTAVEVGKGRADGGMARDRMQEALQQTGITRLKTLEFEIEDDGMPAPGTPGRAGGLTAQTREKEPAIVLRVPALNQNSEFAILHTDEAGGARWLFPAGKKPAAPGRGGAGEVIFHLPRASAPAPKAAAAPGRDVLTKLGRRLVRVLVWATDGIVGAAAEAVAAKWESTHRPYGFRPFPALTGDGVPWDRLRTGRALLLVHGTFSSAAAAFAGLTPDQRATLAQLYSDRVFAFDHPSLHHSPQENIKEFFAMVPPGTPLELDLVTHSRGGLVARELVERQAEFDMSGKRVRVRKVVMVASPNSGTILADGDHGIDLLDRYTNLLTELPDNVYTFCIEGVLALVKVVAHGALAGLPGLNCMLPGGAYLQRLNVKATFDTQYYAAAANFVPTAPGLIGRLGGMLAGRVIASVFEHDNDGVVPTEGCYGNELSLAAFPVPVERRLVLGKDDHVHHCNYFGNQRVVEAMMAWLKE